RPAAVPPGFLELGADAVHAPGDVQRRGPVAGGRLRTHGWPSFAVMEELGCPHYFPPPFGEELLDQAERLALQKDFRRRWGRLPNLHGPVLAGAGQALAVLAERHAPDQVRVPLEGEEFLSGGRLPDLHKLVLAGGDEALAVWAVRHAGHEARVSFEAHPRSSQLAPGRRSGPGVRRWSAAGEGQALAVWAEGHGEGDGSHFDCKQRRGGFAPALRHVPDYHGLIRADRGEALTIGTERHAPDPARMPLQN